MNRSLINCSIGKIPNSPRVRDADEPKPHRIFEDDEDELVAEGLVAMLKTVPSSRKDWARVCRKIFSIVSEIRKESDWLVIKDTKQILDLHVSMTLCEQQFKHIHIGEFNRISNNNNDDEDFKEIIPKQPMKVEKTLCNDRNVTTILKILENKKDSVLVLRLYKVEITMENLLRLIKNLPNLEDLRLSYVNVVKGNQSSALFKSVLLNFTCDLKSLRIHECNGEVSSFLDLLPGHSIEKLYVRANSMENIKKFIQNHKKMKNLNLQLLEELEPFDREIFEGIELTHLTLFILNKNGLDLILERQNKLQYLKAPMQLSMNVIEKMSTIEDIEEFSFRGDVMENSVIEKIAKFKKLQTVTINFGLGTSKNVIVHVLSIFFKSSYKFSVCSNACEKFLTYKLAKAIKVVPLKKKIKKVLSHVQPTAAIGEENNNSVHVKDSMIEQTAKTEE